MYTINVFGSVLYWPVRKLLKPLPLWAFVIFIPPLVIDGGSHLMSDLAGIGHGFRDSNTWLAILTGNICLASFYSGDALGSFNSWARLITGALLGIGIVTLAYPYLESKFADIAREIEDKFRRAGLEV